MGYEVIEEKEYGDIIKPTCPSCRREVPFGAEICPYCGYQLKEGVVTKKVEVKEAAPAKRVKKKKKSRGKALMAAGSIIILAVLGFLSALYFLPAILLVILAIVILISLSSG